MNAVLPSASPSAPSGVLARLGEVAGAAWRHRLAPFGLLVAALPPLAYVRAVDPNEPGHFPACPLLQLTGLYCPGCGATRMVHALLHGDLVGAAHMNLLTLVTLPVLAFLWALWARRRWMGRVRDSVPPTWVMWTWLAVTCLFAVARNVPGSWLAPG